MDSLLAARGIDPDVDEAILALDCAQWTAQLETSSMAVDGFFSWAVGLIDLIAGLEPSAATKWYVARRALESPTATTGSGVPGGESAELLETIDLADLVDVCGQRNRAAPFVHDPVCRFYKKSVTEGSIFRDVRMTPAHFDELVALSIPHLPQSSCGPSAIPPACRIFTVVFSLAQGGRQRVNARAVDVAESTFSKHCAPVIDAMLAGPPKPDWPGCAERREISQDFARMTGGNAAGRKGLYVCGFFPCLLSYRRFSPW